MKRALENLQPLDVYKRPLYDSVLDRYSEMVTLFGIFYYLILQGYLWGSMITFVALVGSLMVSYVRARAEGLGLECKVGFMPRPERVVLTSLGALCCGIFGDCKAFDPMLILIVPMAVIEMCIRDRLWSLCGR